jgi:hypothetical protein
MKALINVLAAGMIVMVPSCTCTEVQTEKWNQCVSSLAEVATSDACLGQCLDSNWVGCAIGCGLGLLEDAIPPCYDALAGMFTTAPGAGSAPGSGPAPLVCRPDAPPDCAAVWNAVEKRGAGGDQ